MAQASTVLVSMLLNVGVAPDELALASGVPLEQILGSTLIPYEDGMRLWRAAETLTGDPLVGLRAGSTFGLDQLSVLGTAFGHAVSLRDALVGLTRLLPLVIRDAPIDYADEDGTGRLRYVSPGADRHGVDCMFAAIVKAARECTRRRIALAGIALQSPAPRDAAPYVAFFGALPRWGAAASELRFRADDLDAPMRGAEPAIAALLEDRAVALFHQADAHPALERSIEAAVRAGLARGDVSLGAIAGALGRSTRSLQRDLGERGLSYASIRDRVLLARARELLADDRRAVSEVAADLGFASRTAFARAYRRWTGASPRAARRER